MNQPLDGSPTWRLLPKGSWDPGNDLQIHRPSHLCQWEGPGCSFLFFFLDDLVIFGQDSISQVKRAIACSAPDEFASFGVFVLPFRRWGQLFGGSRKQLPSGNRLRGGASRVTPGFLRILAAWHLSPGDINVLLLGDPGTAKSQAMDMWHWMALIVHCLWATQRIAWFWPLGSSWSSPTRLHP